MGLLSKLGGINKKTCALCGSDAKMFNRTKLADGYVCHDCLTPGSPFWQPVRSNTVAQVRDHMAYRERNQEALKDFHPGVTLGTRERYVLIDQDAGTFVLTDDDESNPDLLSLSQVRDVSGDVYEHDVTSTDSDGDSAHEYYEYTFYLVVELDHPQLRRAKFAINERPVRKHGRRIKPRDATAYYEGSKEIKGELLWRQSKEEIERYMEWYAEQQEMIAQLREAAGL